MYCSACSRLAGGCRQIADKSHISNIFRAVHVVMCRPPLPASPFPSHHGARPNVCSFSPGAYAAVPGGVGSPER